ncbi:IclR family transcriptional regulator [Embleya hyalina]|uniref:Putative transcriptional regulator, IclR n=1 Tax=Embleya hyalina TaxID=516124 RepID=A0A401YEM3_9ACTN|nr:IclR family transcriptional regulator C-terminal domain-containing protein [Embleya hyalina]GCD93053.1 putative transcriptional regulator, IclR [Embleya hyalina]
MTTTFDRGLALLDAIVAAELGSTGYPGNAQLAERIGLDQAQTSRMLKDLAAAGLVERDEPSRGWRAGPGWFALAAAAGDGELLRGARPLLRALVARRHEPAWLSVRSGTAVLTVGSEASHWASYVAATPGALTPLWCTGPGRALLLDHSDRELAELLDGVSFVGGGPRAARDLATLAARNAEARAAGVVVADREFEHDVVDFSAPVRDRLGTITAALSLAVPRFRLGGHTAEIAASVAEAARALQVRTGAASGPGPAATRAGRTADRPAS